MAFNGRWIKQRIHDIICDKHARLPYLFILRKERRPALAKRSYTNGESKEKGSYIDGTERQRQPNTLAVMLTDKFCRSVNSTPFDAASKHMLSLLLAGGKELLGRGSSGAAGIGSGSLAVAGGCSIFRIALTYRFVC
ncbi:hypothetical protein RJT34_13842 [Clitoria ternatea]|uniref:Uncharacterized protein n=1 Tax=Clitoria ternatea TaxID=43366 RepID=A0AAN9PKJ4_CLITE